MTEVSRSRAFDKYSSELSGLNVMVEPHSGQ